ncbi:ACT domain-containing protein [Pseudonocardia sp.]|uniref:ACT domain-containing protein n=1 Tax=Pseudonocardia sp. TaxID=60912 RepID=UPI00260526E0|nr:ACT domain-containing protein [Pseudonocardia sp.]
MTAGLAALLAGLDPWLRPGTYVFATVAPGTALDVEPVASMAEDEGRTVVLAEADVARLGLAATYRCAWITLRVASPLESVGLLARVTAALAERGISVNPVAGYHHDHLFVPRDRAEDAMAALAALRPDPPHPPHPPGPSPAVSHAVGVCAGSGWPRTLGRCW